MPESVARERLAAAPLPAPLVAFAGGKVVLVREDGGLLWRMNDLEHRSTARVALERDGAATNVTIRFDLADNAMGGSPIAGTMITKSMAKSMFIEHVDAVLSGRPFDPQRSMMTTALEMQANPRMLEEYGEAIGQQFNHVSTMLNADLEAQRWESGPAHGGRAATKPNENSFKPMIDVSQ